MQVVIHELLSQDNLTLHCAQDTTIGKPYECRKFLKFEPLVDFNGEELGVDAEEDSFIYVDDAGDIAELFLSDVDATFTE